MTKTLLIIISGPPCAGKTTLARRIAKQVQLPLIAKDDIKETLFNRLGWKDRDWSKLLGRGCYDLMFYLVESQLAAGRSHIVESNFDSDIAAQTFLELKSKYHFEPLQIQCRAAGHVLFQRFKERSESGSRHPGHADHLNYDEMQEALLKGKYEAMNIGGQVLEVDTTDFEAIDCATLLQTIRFALTGMEAA